MTVRNDDRIRCHRISCYGVVKEYTPDGPRDPPEELLKERNTISKRIKRLLKRLLGKETKELKWHECSICHEYHPELADQ